jgi:hypothetical protein
MGRFWKRMKQCLATLLTFVIASGLLLASVPFLAVRLRLWDATQLATSRRGRRRSLGGLGSMARGRSGQTKNVLQIQERGSWVSLVDGALGKARRIVMDLPIPLVILEDESTECLSNGLASRRTPVADSLEPGLAMRFKHNVDVRTTDKGPSNRKWARVWGPRMFKRGIRSIQRWCIVHPMHSSYLSAFGLVGDGNLFGNLARFSIALGTYGACQRMGASMKAYIRRVGVTIRPLAARPVWIQARIAEWIDLFLPLDKGAGIVRRMQRRLFLQWNTDLPSSREIQFFTDRPVTKEEVIAGLDECVDKIFARGKAPIRASHRWQGHEDVQEFHGGFCTWKGAGEACFPEAVSPGSVLTEVVNRDDDPELAAQVEQEAGIFVLGNNVPVAGQRAEQGYAAIYRKNASKVGKFIEGGAEISITLARTIASAWRTAEHENTTTRT